MLISDNINLEILDQALDELEVSKVAKTIYLRLIQDSKINLSQMMKEIGVSRSRFYQALDELESTDLCQKNSRGIWLPNSPKFLYAKIKSKQAKISQLSFGLETQLDSLENLFESNHQKNQVKVYSGKEPLKELAARFASELKNDYIGFGNSEVLESVIGQEIEEFWIHQRKKRKIKLRLLLQDKSLVSVLNQDDVENLRETRFMSSKWEIPGYFNLSQNKAICWLPGQYKAIEISESIFITSMQSMFEVIWHLQDLF